MSRYNVQNSAGETFTYGFDNPLSEYFAQKGSRTIVGMMSKVHGNAMALYECLQKHGLWDKIPESHRQAIMGDLPFEFL